MAPESAQMMLLRLSRLSPLLGQLRGYTRTELRGDVLAGLTTAILLVPQAMAYALLAGLPPIVGLYAALIPPVLYAFLGTSRQLAVGPVAMDSLLVAAGVGAIAETGTTAYLDAAIALALMMGVFQVILGSLRLGFLVNLLSRPVISGFTSAAALLIAMSQAKHFLGVSLGRSSTALEFAERLREISEPVQTATLLLAVTAVLILFTFKKKAPRFPAPLIVVVVGTVLAAGTVFFAGVPTVGEVPAGLPGLRLPQLSVSLLLELLPTALTISLVAFMESIAVSKAYARKNRYPIAPDRELLALGAANVAGSFFGGYPVTGGFSRTAVNAGAGAKSQVSALVTVFFVGLSLLFLTPLFYHLPKAILSAIIVTAVLGLVDAAEVERLQKVKPSDLVLLLMTFAATLLLGIIPGVAVGVGASLLWFVYRTTRPHLAVLGRVPGTTLYRNVLRRPGLIVYRGVIVVRMDAQFYFGNVAYLREALATLESERLDPTRAVVLDSSAINALDSSAEAALAEMNEEYAERGVELFLTGVKGPVKDVLESSGLSEILGSRARCSTVHEAVSSLGAEPCEDCMQIEAEKPAGSVGRRASIGSARL